MHLVDEKQKHHAAFNRVEEDKTARIFKSRDFSKAPNPVDVRLAESILTRIKKNDQRRTGEIRDYLQRCTDFNVQHWSDIPVNLR